MLPFNCGNINTVTGLQAGTARKISSKKTETRGFYIVKIMPIETGIHQQFYSIGRGISSRSVKLITMNDIALR